MSFRLRLTVLASLAVAVAIVGASIVVYYTDRHELLSQVDSDLSSSLALPPLNTVVSGPLGFARAVRGTTVRRSFPASGCLPIPSGRVQSGVAALVHGGAGAGALAQARRLADEAAVEVRHNERRRRADAGALDQLKKPGRDDLALAA